MRFQWDKKYLYWGLTSFLVIVSSLLVFFCILRFEELASAIGAVIDILKPVLYGIVFAYLLTPLVNLSDKWLLKLFSKRGKKPVSPKFKRGARCLSIFLALVLMLLLLSALISMIIPQLIESIASFANGLPGYLERFSVWINQYLESEPQLAQIANTLFETITNNYEQWWENLRPALNSVLTGVTVGVFGVINGLKNILIGLIISIYLLFSKDIFAAQAKKITYALLETRKANIFISGVRHSHKVLIHFIVGKLIDSLIIGVICFIGMNLLGLPMTLLISVIIGVTNVIPFFGPFIGAIPSTLILLLINPMSWQWVTFVIFVFALQQFDGNILGPKILGESTGLSSFWVIFAILVAGGLFGFVGMVVGVPFFAVIYGGLRALISRSLKGKGLPAETEDYKGLDHIDEATRKGVKQQE